MRKFFLLLLGFFLAFQAVQGQSIDELQKRKQNAMKKLEMTNSLIKENDKNKAKSMTQLKVLNAEIRERQAVINSINSEVSMMNRKLSKMRNEAASMQKQLDQLKNEYAQLMYHNYFKKNKYESLLFVLSAKDFTESYRRFRYIKQYSEYCEKKAEEIKEAKIQLDHKLKEVEEVRLERLKVLNERQRENDQLKNKKMKKAALVKKLKKKGYSLRSELKRQQRIADKLNQQIERKIAEEAKKAQAGKGKGDGYALTKEEKLISGGFEANKGRLPWPVLKGVVVGRFGVHPHPVLEYVTTNNKGIYIQCPKGTMARAVYAGVVTQVFSVPGSNNKIGRASCRERV